MAAQGLRISVFDDYIGQADRFFPASDLAREFGAQTIFHRDHLVDPGAIIARADGADVVVVMRERTPLGRDIIERLKRTRLIVTTGPRNASIDEQAVKERGITLCGAGATDSATAELTWGLLLALVRRIPVEHQGILEGRWGLGLGDHLKGRTLGILGLGTIGAEVARYGRAFGMDVIAAGLTLTDERAVLHGARKVDRDTLFRQSDVVSIHLRLTAETRGAVGWRELSLMAPSSYLVNTARGALVDEEALIDALRLGKIRGAALDVFQTEPLPATSLLRTLDNVILTPHIGYSTEQRFRSYYESAGESVAWFLRGRPVRVIVAPENSET